MENFSIKRFSSIAWKVSIAGEWDLNISNGSFNVEQPEKKSAAKRRRALKKFN